MGRTGEMVRTGAVAIETYVEGDGPTLVILPSYGRDGGADYDDITVRAARAGWRVLRPQPRGVAGSRGPMTGVTLHDLADDVAAVIRTLGGGRAVLLGHAFGHAVSRMLATDHPDLVTAVNRRAMPRTSCHRAGQGSDARLRVPARAISAPSQSATNSIPGRCRARIASGPPT